MLVDIDGPWAPDTTSTNARNVNSSIVKSLVVVGIVVDDCRFVKD